MFVGRGRRRRVKAESLDINSDGQRPSNQNALPALSPERALSRFCPFRAWNMLSLLRRALPVAVDFKAFSLAAFGGIINFKQPRRNQKFYFSKACPVNIPSRRLFPVFRRKTVSFQNDNNIFAEKFSRLLPPFQKIASYVM